MNVSAAPIVFTLYGSFGVYNSAVVLCVLVFYLSGVCVNLLLVVVICVESRLHRPMYVLLVNLSLSGLVGSSSVCPSLLTHLVGEKQEAPLTLCLLQVFFCNVYAGCVFCVLALMAFDRYVSICKPLLYHAIVTPARLRLMLGSVYLSLTCFSAVQVYLVSRLQLCSHAVEKLVCDSLAVAKLSCEPAVLVSVFGLCGAVCSILLPCLLIVLSYAHIFTVIVKTSPEGRRKALHTCAPHLVTFVNFAVASFFGVIYNRLSANVPKSVTVLFSMNFFVFPPLLHPIIYGIKMQEIRQSMNKVMREKLFQL